MATTTDMDVRNSQSLIVNDYFGLKSGDELVNALLKKADDYYSHVEKTGRLGTWKRMYKNYYLGSLENARIKTGGDKSQYLLVQVNHFANILSHIVNSVTGARPTLKPRAMNSDFKSMAQTKVASPVIDYYMTEKLIEAKGNEATELSVIFDHAYLFMAWDAFAGRDVTVGEDGRPVKDGDINAKAYSPLDCITDFTCGNAKKPLWRIFRDWENKWDLAAQFPQYGSSIIAGSGNIGTMRQQRFGHPMYEADSDMIPVYTLVHDRCTILPEGRMVKFIESDNVIMLDLPLPHKKLWHRIAPKEQQGTVWGYTVGYDLLPVQENINLLYSIIASNQSMFGVQSVLLPKGSGVQYSQLQGGLKIVEYDAKPGVDSKPSVLQLTATPAEIFNHIQHLITQMETISGVNSVVRGQPEASLKSGAALALVASQSIQFMSSFHGAYVGFLESIGTSLIDILKNYANEPRLISIAGKNNSQYMKQFKGADIDKIERVTVEVGNALTRTTAGKLQIAEDLIKNNMIENAKQYLQVLETGTLEPLTQGSESQLMLIAEENEALTKGEQVMAAFTDMHFMHIQEHACVLANLEARANPQAVEATMAHIQEHVNLSMTMNPIVAAATGQPAPMGPPPGGAGSGMNAAQVMNPQNPVEKKAAQVNLPTVPQAPNLNNFAATGGR